jgi:hypothetical protein
MSEAIPVMDRDLHFTFNDVRRGIGRAGIDRGYGVIMGSEQSGLSLLGDMSNPTLRECVDDMERAFPDISGNQWMFCISDRAIHHEALVMSSNGFVNGLADFIRIQVPRRLGTYMDPQTNSAEGLEDAAILSLELGKGYAVDIKASGDAWGDGDYVHHDVELRAVFRCSNQTSSSR